MHQVIEQDIDPRGIVDPATPTLDGKLAGKNGGVTADAVIDRFQHLMPGVFLLRASVVGQNFYS